MFCRTAPGGLEYLDFSLSRSWKTNTDKEGYSQRFFAKNRDAMKLAPSAGAPAAGSIDLHLDDIQAKTDPLTFTISNVLDANVAGWQGQSFSGAVTNMIQDPNNTPQWTEDALALAPSGGGGSSDWTATEREQIRYRLQFDGTQTAPAVDAPAQLPIDVQAWDGSTGSVKNGATSGLPQVDTTSVADSPTAGLNLADFALSGYDPATDQVNGVKLVDVTTTNTDMRGTDGANTVAPDNTQGAAVIAHGDGAGAWGAVADVSSVTIDQASVDAIWDEPRNQHIVLGSMGWYSGNLVYIDGAVIPQPSPSTLLADNFGTLFGNANAASPLTLDAVSTFDAASDGVFLTSTGLNNVLIDGRQLPNAIEIIAASAIGRVSGAQSGTETFLGLDQATTRAVVTVDQDGNRTAIVYS